MATAPISVHGLEQEDSEDDFQYEEVEVISDDEDNDVLSEDLDTALRNLQAFGNKKHEESRQTPAQSNIEAAGVVNRKQEVMDDFIRNFFVKMGLQRTSETFETEWYELKANGKLAGGVSAVPDVYLHNMVDTASKHSTLQGAQEHSPKIKAGAFIKEAPPAKGSPGKSSPISAKTGDDKTSNVAVSGTKKASNWPPLPTAPRKNPYLEQDISPALINSFTLQKTFKGHLLSIANICLHPTKPIVVTASDDKTWKMWHLPHGDLIMSGEGHKDWVAGIDFHPQGMCLASGSGDSTVKIWDFERQCCVKTCTDHKQAVWSVCWHDLGDYVASGSLDHTARIWDVQHERCRTVLRGHVDSVNEVAWQPYTNNLATCSSDKTVSVWDTRSGLCCQTYYGHQNSCNTCLFNPSATLLASTDADGIAKLWDVRMVAEILSIVTSSKHPANKCAFDRSGMVLAVASDDERIKCFNKLNGELICEMTGHEDTAQAVVFDQNNQFMVTVGADQTFRIWS